jgi:hypothetical protein
MNKEVKMPWGKVSFEQQREMDLQSPRVLNKERHLQQMQGNAKISITISFLC